MAHFLNSAVSVLNPVSSVSPSTPVTTTPVSPSPSTNSSFTPRIIISLVEGQETRWDLISVAKKSKLRILDCYKFDESEFDGYVCKRNKNGQSFKNFHTKKRMGSFMGSFVYKFVKCEEKNLNENNLIRENHNFIRENENFDSEIVLAKDKKLVLSGFIEEVFDPEKYKDKKQRKLETLKTGIIYTCPSCDRKYISFRGVGQHYHQTHILKENSEEGEYHCNNCSRIFTSHSNLTQHYLSKHTDLSTDTTWQPIISSDKEYGFIACDVCGQCVQDSDDGMFIHLESLKPLVGMKLYCPFSQEIWCNKKEFLEVRALEQHYRVCRVNKNRV